MKDPVRRDSLLTIIGLSLLVAAFVFAVYIPGKKACAQVERDIETAEQTIRDIPLRLAELDSLQKDIRRRSEYLRRNDRLVPGTIDSHTIIAFVSRLARNSNLIEGPLEPLDVAKLKTYQIAKYHFSFSGQFRDIATFLKGLETQDRLVAVDELELTSDDSNELSTVQGKILFSVYARHAELIDFAEINDSSPQPHDDTE